MQEITSIISGKKTLALVESGGIAYLCSLDQVYGAGASVWHLMVGNYYWGRLRLTGSGVFILDSNRDITHQALDLGKYLGYCKSDQRYLTLLELFRIYSVNS